MMRKLMWMGGAAMALALAPVVAGAQEVTASGSIEYSNRVDATVDVDSYLDKDLTLFGGTLALGLVVTDSAAVAIVDNKQILVGNSVTFEEENELNGENGYVSSVFGPGWSEGAVGEEGGLHNGGSNNGVAEGNIRAGFFAPVINNVAGATINATGNVGVNMAAGQYNVQENVAAIAASNYNDLNTDDTGDVTGHTGGWASASLVSLQNSSDNFYGPDVLEVLPEDGGLNNYRDRNTVGAQTVGGAGNIGLNAAAGAFNMQKNALVIAVVADSALAEANAAVIQASYNNEAMVQDTINTVEGVSVTGSGNIGVNIAAGVGNMQQNSLVMSLASGAAAPAGPPPPPPTQGGSSGQS